MRKEKWSMTGRKKGKWGRSRTACSVVHLILADKKSCWLLTTWPVCRTVKEKNINESKRRKDPQRASREGCTVDDSPFRAWSNSNHDTYAVARKRFQMHCFSAINVEKQIVRCRSKYFLIDSNETSGIAGIDILILFGKFSPFFHDFVDFYILFENTWRASS